MGHSQVSRNEALPSPFFYFFLKLTHPPLIRSDIAPSSPSLPSTPTRRRSTSSYHIRLNRLLDLSSLPFSPIQNSPLSLFPFRLRGSLGRFLVPSWTDTSQLSFNPRFPHLRTNPRKLIRLCEKRIKLSKLSLEVMARHSLSLPHQMDGLNSPISKLKPRMKEEKEEIGVRSEMDKDSQIFKSRKKGSSAGEESG